MGSKRVDHWTSGTVHMWMQWDCRLSTSNCLGSWWSCTTPWAIPVAGRATSDNGETVPVTRRGGHAQLFFLIPQSQFRNLQEALPQSQFCNIYRNVAPQLQLPNSAIAIFSDVRNFKSATWELHFRNFWHIFGCGIQSCYWTKIVDKKSHATVPLRQVWVPGKQTVLKIFLVDF